MAADLLRMGRLGRPHGIRGEIGADWHGGWRPAAGDRVYLQGGDGEPVPVVIASARMHNGRLLLKLEGIGDRTQAAGLTGNAILASRSQAGGIADDEVFAADLAGYRVLLTDGSELGRIDHVEFPAGRMIWAITDQNGVEILFPADSSFIAALDAQKRQAVIEPPPGLLDIYRA
ncbi:MAG: 16S rRNA processing protein RimM [Desulfovibrio sp.]|nr:16S rRNA processing protein RimM [Desulfovibrio sp.]